MKRIISAILGTVLIIIVIYLGIMSGSNNAYIVPFGLGSALIAPIGVSALGYSIKKEDMTIKKLAQIPEIKDLISQAEAESKKIDKLKKSKDLLISYIIYETRKSAIMERKKFLEEDAKRIVGEYEKAIEELNEIEHKRLGDLSDNKEENEEIAKLYQILRARNDADELQLSFLGKNYRIRCFRDFYNLPAQILVDLLFQVFSQIYKFITKKKDIEPTINIGGWFFIA